MFRLETPGGGGYGTKEAMVNAVTLSNAKKQNLVGKGSLYNYDQIQTSA